jgi:hypothetical protein
MTEVGIRLTPPGGHHNKNKLAEKNRQLRKKANEKTSKRLAIMIMCYSNLIVFALGKETRAAPPPASPIRRNRKRDNGCAAAGSGLCRKRFFFLGSRYFSYQTHGFVKIASFGTSIFRLQLLYLWVQRNGFTA